MQRMVSLAVAALLAVALQAGAQQGAAAQGSFAVPALAASFGEIATYVTKSAEQASEADLAFKATPEVRSLGAILAHVAEVNYAVCALVLGKENPGPDIEKTRTTKAGIEEAVRASFAFCKPAYAISDAEAGQTVTLWGESRSRAFALTLNLTHDWEHYGNVVTYLRLRGKTPPSSQPTS